MLCFYAECRYAVPWHPENQPLGHTTVAC
jgi:hypothetical protein